MGCRAAPKKYIKENGYEKGICKNIDSSGNSGSLLNRMWIKSRQSAGGKLRGSSVKRRS